MYRVRLFTLAPMGVFAIVACNPAPRDASDGRDTTELEAPAVGLDSQDESEKTYDGTPADANCRVDADCVVSGCGSQVCAPEARMTTCIFKPEFACYQDPGITTCGCHEGRCGWDETDALAGCLSAPPAP